MQVTLERVTPRMAAAWLNMNTHNRKLRSGVAERYAADMMAGRWTSCPEPISFYADGRLADGQHRLFAIVESDVAITLPIARGLTLQDGLNLNTGIPRNVIDNVRLTGIEVDVDKQKLATAKSIHYGTRWHAAPSTSESLAIYLQHQDAAVFATKHVAHAAGLCSSLITGAVGRAWYFETDKQRLARFCSVLANGLHGAPGEIAATAIRNYLKANPGNATAGQWIQTFAKVQNAIWYFMRSQPLLIIKAVSDEAYPFPTVEALGLSRQSRAKRLRSADREAA